VDILVHKIDSLVHKVLQWYRVYGQGLLKQIGTGITLEGSRRVVLGVRIMVKIVVLGSKTAQISEIGIWSYFDIVWYCRVDRCTVFLQENEPGLDVNGEIL
jgi:hypothetical protein